MTQVGSDEMLRTDSQRQDWGVCVEQVVGGGGVLGGQSLMTGDEGGRLFTRTSVKMIVSVVGVKL